MQFRVNQTDRRATWQGFGDGLSQAVEMSVAPVLFALLGLYLDRRVGTVPLFAVGFSIFAMVGVFVKAYYVYRFKSEQEEEARSWGKRSP
jgi:F0F1-type ATP synthase assembly protein I